MGGHCGRIGHGCTNCNEMSAFNGAPSAFQSLDGLSHKEPLIPNPLDEWVEAASLWDSVVKGKYTYTGNYLYGGGAAAAPEERDLDIHLIWHSHQAALGTTPDVIKGVEAHRKVDFVVADAQFFTPNAQYADIVLPVCTAWETWQPGAGVATANSDTRFFPQKVMDPLFESKTSIWIARELASRMGVEPDVVAPKSEEQLFFDYVAGTRLVDGTEEGRPLVTLTQEDIDIWSDKLGITWEYGPQGGEMTMDELLEAGVYTRKRSANDGLVTLAWKDFVDDPAANPLPSASGKFEIYCQAYADECNMQGRSTIKPYPTYLGGPGTYEDSFTDWENKVQGEYCFQIFTPHYLRRAHSVFDNSPWLRETFANPVFMNVDDAKKLGVEAGGTVVLYNQRGSILRQAMPTATFMPGVLGVPHGAWLDLDDAGVDRAGTENVLIGGPSTGWGVSGYNTTLVGLKKYEGETLVPDCDLPAREVNVV